MPGSISDTLSIQSHVIFRIALRYIYGFGCKKLRHWASKPSVSVHTANVEAGFKPLLTPQDTVRLCPPSLGCILTEGIAPCMVLSRSCRESKQSTKKSERPFGGSSPQSSIIGLRPSQLLWTYFPLTIKWPVLSTLQSCARNFRDDLCGVSNCALHLLSIWLVTDPWCRIDIVYLL